MITLLRKEIAAFLSSLIGYIVMIVFVTAIGLFMWIFPGNFNVLEAGYSNIDTLFIIAPWVFMFLAPAITMKMFSEEKRTGTIELLLTKPLTDWDIILSKFFAGFILVLLSLLPTLTYYISVHYIGAQEGNIDTGGMWGSYFGLLFLSAAFVAIGLFASSITSSQIVAFILAVFLSFFFYIGFESIGSFDLLGSFDGFIIKLGINDHYISMSRGVIDTRDVVYFVSLSGLFLLFTKTVLESRKW
jgi:ABC-2 type transport system permease protein